MDLEEYSIYSQVQFCLKGDCLSKGNYWTPDFVLVRTKKIAGQDVTEAIIVDSKLSAGTGWTPNQTAAQKMTGWNVKSINDKALIKKGSKAGILAQDTKVVSNSSFKKLYKNGENAVFIFQIKRFFYQFYFTK